MSDPYIQEINRIDAELKRVAIHTKQLREQKAKLKFGLYQYMRSHNLDRVQYNNTTITLKSCEPKEKKMRVSTPKAQRRKDAINILRDAGIPNPEELYLSVENTQKGTTSNSENVDPDDLFGSSNKKGKKRGKKDNGIDECLGF